MAHPNVERARKGYAAFGEGDLETLQELFADDVVWHVPGDNLLSGDYKGQQEVFELFGRLSEETQGSFRLEVHDILANDEHGVVLVRASGTRNGMSLDGDPQVHVFHMTDGRITEFWNHPYDMALQDEFWS